PFSLIVTTMLQHQPHRPLTNLHRIPLVLSHQPILSRTWASKVHGAVHRAIRGELGTRHVPLDSTHYDLREGDHVAFIAQHHQRGHARVENGSRGEITQINQDHSLTVILDGSSRTIRLAGEQVENLRLAYAQHVYRQQGATVERSIVLTGGWQTSKETAYVQATRARHGTDWYVARDQLGEEGQDANRITRLARAMTNSRAAVPSVLYRERSDPSRNPMLNPFRVIPGVGRLAKPQARPVTDYGLPR
ncbi:MAG: hypothetical protein ACTHM1_00735, partial [Solirubrobacteraceae bacterium]